MLKDRPNRTFISSVLFLDIVGYSKRPVAEQIQLKEQFNNVVSHLISDIPESDRIVLDTGDGAALSFLGDPEDALFVAVKLRDAIKEKHAAEFPDMHLRMGINLGPVKLLKDINGRPNLIGDGINVAQRVMNFAEPDQILVSRSFYDVVSCLSDEYRNFFSHQGTQTDKHVREHELYEIGFVDPDRSVTIEQRMQVLETRARVPQEQISQLEAALEPHVGDHAHVLVQAKAMNAYDFASLRDALASYIPDPAARAAFMRLEPGVAGKPAGGKPAWLVPALAGAAVVLLAILIWLAVRPAPPPQLAQTAPPAPAPAPVVPAATPAPAADPVPAPAAVPAKSTETAPAAKAEVKSASPAAAKATKGPEKAPAKDAKAPAPAPTGNPPASPAKSADTSAAASAANTRSASLRFQISGNAEIYVDGIRVGPSGGVSVYAVTPGEHKIQIRECGFPPDTKNQSVNVDANASKLVVASC